MLRIVEKMRNLLAHLTKRILGGESVEFEQETVCRALNMTVEDVRYHYPDMPIEEVRERIICQHAELAVFLFRLGSEMFKKSNNDRRLSVLSGLLRDTCSCEIYFSNTIGTGLFIVHGVGVVIGSRNCIGKGFLIYQNATVGHLTDKQPGAYIGDNVTLFAGSQILGPVTIGDNVIVGGHSLVTSNIPHNAVCAGIPATVLGGNAREKMPFFRPNFRSN